MCNLSDLLCSSGDLVLVHRFNLLLMLVKHCIWSGVSDLFVRSVSEVLDVASALLLTQSSMSGCLVVLGFPLLDVSNRNYVFLFGFVGNRFS